MNFIQTVEKLDPIIKEYSTRLLSEHITMKVQPLKNIYNNTIFNSMQISGYASLYKIVNNVAVWLINDITDSIYLESIDDYLKSNTTEHGKLVYKSYLNNKKYYNDDYFAAERNRICNTQGLIFILTEKNERQEIVKKCYFHHVNF